MYLEEVVLDNFKSFGDRTRLPLRDDFTAITGPNGSGKSNILDAIQFALGLGRVSDVRAKRLTDLIHHSDDSEPSLPREAQVTVIVNNEDRTLSPDQIAAAMGDEVLDPDHIEIRRRIRQTAGNSYSYYYINDKSVNLGDIQELMAQAGVSDERYNIVPQGDITELINRTPMQRRLIIDEIAGIAEFDAKKEQARRELDTVRERIDEVSLRIEEKSVTLEQLADEREEALAYRELADEKAQFERYRDAAELTERRDELSTVEERIDGLETDLEEARHELAEVEEEARRIEEDIEDLTDEIERKGGEEQRALQEEIEELRSAIGQLEGRIEEKYERIGDLRDDRRDAELKLDKKQETIDDLDADRRDIEVRKADRTGDLVSVQEELADVQADIDALDAEQRKLNVKLAKQDHLRTEALDTRDALQREFDRLNDEARRRDRELESIDQTLEDVRERRDDYAEEIDGLDLEMDRLREERREVQGTIESLDDERESLEGDRDDLQDEIDAMKARFRELRRQQADAGKGQFPRAVARVLGSGIDGVHGAVASLGDVEKEDYAVACEAAGGARLANVVVERPAVGQTCIEYLKERDAGRATMLPISEFGPRGLPPLPDHPGVVDFARNLVTYDDQYEGIFSYVLGSTLVVENMETAREFMGEYRMVTLDGDVVEQSGAMRGGSGRETPFQFGGSKGRLERLAAKIEKLEQRRDEVIDRYDEVTDRLAEARERDRTLRDDLRDLERERASHVDTVDRLDGRIETIVDQRDTIEDQRTTTREEIGRRTNELAAAEAAVEAIQATVDGLSAALAHTRLGELTERRSKLREERDEIRADIDRLDGKLNEIALEVRAANERIEEFNTTITEAQNAIADREEEIDELEDAIAGYEAEIGEHQSAIDELEADLTELRAAREDRRTALDDVRETVNERRRTVNTIEAELGPLRDRRERLEWEIDELEQSVEPIEEDADIPAFDVVTDRIAELETEMEAMKPINEKAVEQYDRLDEQIDGLEADVAELDAEREGILERIDSYETQKREAFMEAYEAIDAEFRDVFRTLSGGTAALELENEDDPFDGGLVMLAQPGDKFVGSLDQLSGGEKSLTALSLIFAIQRYRPAPFYALDEIDAFLDAANLDRIGELLEAHRDDGQFIVISHHSDLLERADRIIGVSMPEEISRVSGVQLAGGVPADD